MEAATIGHNEPPAHLEYVEQANDLKETAKGFLDGSPITSDKEAEMVAKLIDEAVKLDKSAETARKAITEPLDKHKKDVMADFKPVVDTCELIKSAGKKAQTVWLTKLAAEKAEAERIERERLAIERQRLLDESTKVNGLEAMNAIQDAVTDHLAAEKALERSAKEGVKVSGGGRALSLRTVYEAEVTDYAAFARWVWANRNHELMEFLNGLAWKEVRAASGNVTMDGVNVVKKQVAV